MKFTEEEAYLLLEVDNDDEREALWEYHRANTLQTIRCMSFSSIFSLTPILNG